jgi:4-amino-4-deoxy-L-arabinose transferase-like glycosyltransferase
MERPNVGSNIRVAILLAIGVAVISVGQIGRTLLPPDDLREAEVGREMLTSGDFVIPHLAGLPFVEKPPAFPAVLAGAYRLAGGPSALVAHLVSGGFALVSLGMVFLLGRRVAGSEAGALSCAFLALSLRFAKAAHEVHLDNALTAVSAIALTFAWSALDTGDVRLKKRRYAAVAFSLALAFLVKGFVGPALFTVGFLIYVAVSGRKGELRHAFGLIPIASFVGLILVWVVPFLLIATPHLIKDFFIQNQVGRFFLGYGTHSHPLYYHLVDSFWDFVPGSVLVPLAAVGAWRTRREPKSQAGIFFLSMSVGSLLLLMVSRAQGPLYPLPAFPALALLVGCWSSRVLARADRPVQIGIRIVAIAAGLFAAGTVVAMVYYGYSWLSLLCAGLALAALGLGISHAVRHHRFQNAAVAAAGLLALGWIPLFSGPIAAQETAEPYGPSLKKPSRSQASASFCSTVPTMPCEAERVSTATGRRSRRNRPRNLYPGFWRNHRDWPFFTCAWVERFRPTSSTKHPDGAPSYVRRHASPAPGPASSCSSAPRPISPARPMPP